MISKYLKESIKLDNTVETPSSKQFKEWFGKSKVVDGKGNPRVMYHGTSVKFHTFRTSSELGVHVGDLEAARSINNYKSGDLIMSLYVRIENPLRMSDMMVFNPQEIIPVLKKNTKIPSDVTDKLSTWYEELLSFKLDSSKAIKNASKFELKLMYYIQDELKGLGYDGIVYKNQKEGNSDSYIAFDANQIKSIHNKGTWKSKDLNIYN